MARRYSKPPPQVKQKALHMSIYCSKCAKMGIQEWGLFGDKQENYCTGHWYLTAHYQVLKFREFYEVLSKDDK